MSVTNVQIRKKLLEKGLRYYHLNQILSVSDATRCRLMRSELPATTQDMICERIDEFVKKEEKNHA